MNKDTLVEIKRGETGTGLLIENDGFMSISESTKNLNESMSESDGYCPNPFIVDVVLQKFGIKNANGRIYPERVLKRQVEAYMEKIREKRAIGECYRPSAMILTESGWKQLSEIELGERILTLNPETKEIEIKPVKNIINREYNGELIHIKGEFINEFVTPEHGFPIFNKEGDFSGFIKAVDLLDEDSDFGGLYIPTDKEDVTKNAISLNKSDLEVEKSEYNGIVMCVEVDNHIWYVMENGKAHWTKNCNHPAESVIDLSRTSINIVECHWEGHTLVGKMEILVSPGFRKHGIISCCADEIANLLLHGIKIGVSSRGLGTVSQEGGALIVGDDYELVCWDVVSEPSTHGSWVTTKGKEDLAQYIENKQVTKPVISEKLERIEKLLQYL